MKCGVLFLAFVVPLMPSWDVWAGCRVDDKVLHELQEAIRKRDDEAFSRIANQLVRSGRTTSTREELTAEFRAASQGRGIDALKEVGGSSSQSRARQYQDLVNLTGPRIDKIKLSTTSVASGSIKDIKDATQVGREISNRWNKINGFLRETAEDHAKLLNAHVDNVFDGRPRASANLGDALRQMYLDASSLREELEFVDQNAIRLGHYLEENPGQHARDWLTFIDQLGQDANAFR